MKKICVSCDVRKLHGEEICSPNACKELELLVKLDVPIEAAFVSVVERMVKDG